MKFDLNNNVINPKDWEDIALKFLKNGYETETEITTETITLVGDDYTLFKNEVATNGYFKGIPLDISLDNGYTINNYIDPREAVENTYSVTAKVYRRYGNRSFWELADGTTFDLLAFGGVQFDLSEVAYKVKRTDKETQTMLIVLASFSLRGMIQDIVSDVKRIIELAGNPTNVLVIVLAVANLLIKIALTTIFIIQLFNRIKELYFPEVKYHKTCSYKELIVKSIANIGEGYTLDSSIIDYFEDIHYLGRPANRNIKSWFENLIDPTVELSTLGYPTGADRCNGMIEDFTTVGGFLRYVKRAFNLKFEVSNGVVKMERRDTMLGNAQNIITGLKLQDTLEASSVKNTNESWRKCLVRFPQDETDVYTSDLFEPSYREWETQNIDEVTNSDLNLISGGKDVDMVFSYGYREKKLNYIERFIKDFVEDNFKGLIVMLELVATLTGDNTVVDNFFDFIPDEGILVISDNFYSRPKMLVLGANKLIKEDWEDKIGAFAIFRDWHEIDFIGNNDFNVHTKEVMECTNSIFVDLLTSDFADVNGVSCEIVAIEYNENANSALLTYKEPSNYADTVILKYLG